MKKKIKIILADVPMVELSLGFYQPTMGILYLIGALRKHLTDKQFEVHYLEGYNTKEKQKMIISVIKPDIFALSFKTPLAPLAYHVLNEYKQIIPDATFITGGAHSTVMYEEVFENAPVDFVFRGECENTFPAFIENYINESPEIYNTPGIVYRKDKHLIVMPPAPFEAEIDKFAWPAWDLVDFNNYPGMPYRKAFPYLGVVVSRGCPFSCTFCSEPIWKIFGKPSYRAREIENILEEITYLYNKGVREIRLWCEELNTKTSWTKGLMRGIKSLGYKDLYFNFNIRGDNVDEELSVLMGEAGTWMVSMGIESSSNRVLKGIRKSVTIEEIENSARLLSNVGIRIQGYFQFFNAWEQNGQLQTETFSEVLTTLKWAFRQFHKNDLHYMFTSFSTPRPDTPLWQIAERHGLVKKTKLKGMVNYAGIGMSLPGLSKFQVGIIFILSNLLKAYVAILSGNINTKMVFKIIRKHILEIFSKYRVNHYNGY